MTRTITAIPAVAAITALLLAGCVGAGPELPVVVPTDPIEVPVSPSPEPPEEPETMTLPENPEPGLEIPESLARELNRDVSDGLRGYELPDGTFQLVKRDEPLPEAVMADAVARADALPVVTGDGTVGSGQTESINNIDGLRSTLSFETGKRVVVIAYGITAFLGESPRMAYQALGSPPNSQNLIPRGVDADSVRAEVEALIAQQEGNPEEWVIIVQP